MRGGKISVDIVDNVDNVKFWHAQKRKSVSFPDFG